MSDKPTLTQRVLQIEGQVEKMKKDLEQAGEADRAILEAVNNLARIVNGDPQTDTPSLRAMARSQAENIDNMSDWLSRVKWIAVGLGVTNLAQVVGFLAQLITSGAITR